MGAPFIFKDFANAAQHTERDIQQLYEVRAVNMGNLSEEQVFSPLARTLVRQQNQHQKEAEKQKHVLFLNMLEDMRQRLNELDISLAKQLEALQEKYGSNAIEAMAETFLSEDELKGLKTDDARMKALAQKMLNPDGSIKEQYKDLPEALYIRDWQEAEKLRPVVAKYEGRQSLTQSEKVEVAETAQAVGLAGSKNMVIQSTNQMVKDTVDRTIDNNRSEQETANNTTQFNFS